MQNKNRLKTEIYGVILSLFDTTISLTFWKKSRGKRSFNLLRAVMEWWRKYFRDFSFLLFKIYRLFLFVAMEKLRIYSCSLTSRRSTNLFVSFFSVIFGKINAKHEYNVYDTLPVCVGTMKLINSLSSSLTFVTEYAVSRVNYADEKLTHWFKDLPLTYNYLCTVIENKANQASIQY